jgi:hypothetical protein
MSTHHHVLDYTRLGKVWTSRKLKMETGNWRLGYDSKTERLEDSKKGLAEYALSVPLYQKLYFLIDDGLTV